MKFKANAQGGVAYSQLVIQQLRDLGYDDARGELIDMSEFGVPQRRQRFIVIATREGVADSVFETLTTRCSDHLAGQGYSEKKRCEICTVRLATLPRHCPMSRLERFSVWNCTRGQRQAFRSIFAPVQRQELPTVIDSSTTPLMLRRSSKRLLASAPRNRCILGEDREPYGLKKRSVTVLDGNQSAPTVTTIPDDFVHYSEPRVMTVRECARLQTFPDWFEFKGPYTTGGKQRVLQAPRYTQVGNAVPPLFAEMAGLALKEVLSDG